MKKTIIAFLPILLICNYIFSQEENEPQRKWAVKAYVNGDFYKEQTITTELDGIIINHIISSRNIGKVSPAISYTKRKFLQELELTDFGINRTKEIRFNDITGQNVTVTASGGKERQTRIGLRYLAAGIFRPFKYKKISLGIGGSIQPSFHRSKYEPSTSADFPSNSNLMRTIISVLPQIEYDFYKRFFINLSSPFEVFDVLHFTYETENPILPDGKTKNTETVFFPKHYHLRMGLGVRF